MPKLETPEQVVFFCFSKAKSGEFSSIKTENLRSMKHILEEEMKQRTSFDRDPLGNYFEGCIKKALVHISKNLKLRGEDVHV